MRTVSLSGSLRTNVGSKDAAQLRTQGKVPCVIYGGKEQIHFHVDEKDFKPIIYTPEACTIHITVNGKEFKTILQDAQFHKISDKIIHADFLEIIPGKSVTMAIPVKLHGQSKGVKDGGKLVQKFRKLNLRSMIDKMPQYIDINIEDLAIGKSITPADLTIEGVTFLHPENISIVSVAATRNVVEESPSGAAATPAPAPAKK